MIGRKSQGIQILKRCHASGRGAPLAPKKITMGGLAPLAPDTLHPWLKIIRGLLEEKINMCHEIFYRTSERGAKLLYIDGESYFKIAHRIHPRPRCRLDIE